MMMMMRNDDHEKVRGRPPRGAVRGSGAGDPSGAADWAVLSCMYPKHTLNAAVSGLSRHVSDPIFWSSELAQT